MIKLLALLELLWNHLIPLHPAAPEERDNLGRDNLGELITHWFVLVPNEIVSPCAYQSSQNG